VSQVPEKPRADTSGSGQENSQASAPQEMAHVQDKRIEGSVTIEEGSLTRKKYEIPYELCSIWEVGASHNSHNSCFTVTNTIVGALLSPDR
jgi:hypothetical protein